MTSGWHVHTFLPFCFRRIKEEIHWLCLDGAKVAPFTAGSYCSWMISSHKFLQIHPDFSKFLKRTGQLEIQGPIPFSMDSVHGGPLTHHTADPWFMDLLVFYFLCGHSNKNHVSCWQFSEDVYETRIVSLCMIGYRDHNVYNYIFYYTMVNYSTGS